MFLMEDCVSVAAGFEFSPINVEGFPLSDLNKIRNMLMQVLKDSIPEEAENPWVVNVYFSNTYSLSETVADIVNLIKVLNKKGKVIPLKKNLTVFINNI